MKEVKYQQKRQRRSQEHKETQEESTVLIQECMRVSLGLRMPSALKPREDFD